MVPHVSHLNVLEEKSLWLMDYANSVMITSYLIPVGSIVSSSPVNLLKEQILMEYVHGVQTIK